MRATCLKYYTKSHTSPNNVLDEQPAPCMWYRLRSSLFGHFSSLLSLEILLTHIVRFPSKKSSKIYEFTKGENSTCTVASLLFKVTLVLLAPPLYTS